MRLPQASRVREKERDNKMSFQHTLLSDVLKEAADKSPRQNRTNIHTGDDALLATDGQGHGTKTHTPEHLTREDHLFEFMDEISKAIRGVKFAYRYAYSRWVYMPGEPYPMGWVGYGDYRANQIGDDLFGVCSRKIENVRYLTYSDQYHMKMSTRLKTAVRNAKTFLSNYSPMEMAEVDTREVRSGINEALSDLSRKSREDAQNIGLPNADRDEERGTLLNELRHLLNTGHEFIDAGYGARLHTMFESMAELDAHNKQVNMNFVRGYERLGKQMFDVVPVDAANSYNCRVQQEVTRYTMDDLPEDIKGRIAVISMMPDKSYVSGVGYRVNESMFYAVR